MLNSTQCTKPTPVGASGSQIVMAYDCVPAGPGDQVRSGLRLAPVQPISSKAALCGIVSPSRKTELVRISLAVCVCMRPFYTETQAGGKVDDPMATIRIENDTLHVEMQGLEALWAFHGSFAIPLTNIVRASTDKPPAFWESIRLLGTGAYPLKEAGTFRYHGETVFFDFQREDAVLVIDLVPGASNYRHLFVHVDPPDTPAAAAERITAALGGTHAA